VFPKYLCSVLCVSDHHSFWPGWTGAYRARRDQGAYSVKGASISTSLQKSFRNAGGLLGRSQAYCACCGNRQVNLTCSEHWPYRCMNSTRSNARRVALYRRSTRRHSKYRSIFGVGGKILPCGEFGCCTSLIRDIFIIQRTSRTKTGSSASLHCGRRIITFLGIRLL
jgi:hypothetical protein